MTLWGMLAITLAWAGSESPNDIEMETISCQPSVVCSGTPGIPKLNPTERANAKFSIKSLFDITASLQSAGTQWSTDVKLKARAGVRLDGSKTEVQHTFPVAAEQKTDSFEFSVRREAETSVRHYSVSCTASPNPERLCQGTPAGEQTEQEDWGLGTEGTEAPQKPMSTR